MHNGTYIVSKLQQKCRMKHTLSVNYNRNAENKLKILMSVGINVFSLPFNYILQKHQFIKNISIQYVL